MNQDGKIQLPPFPMIPFNGSPESNKRGSISNHGAGRLRVKKACDRCKRQKTKCDGSQPCLTCSKHGHKCEYTTVVPITTIIDKNKDNKHNLKVHGGNDDDGYIKFLEHRVHELEKQVAMGTTTMTTTSSLGGAGGNNETFDRNFYTFSRDKYRVMRRYQNILPHELGSIVFQSLDESQRSGLSVPRIQFYGWNMNGSHYLKQRTLPAFIPLVDLTRDREFGAWLLSFYFKQINPLFGILHEDVFRDQYENYLNSLSQDHHDQSTRLFTSILYLVFAISLRYSEHHPTLPSFIKKKNYAGLEEALFDSGYEVVSKLSFEWESFELVQSWILITLYLRTCHRQISSYTSLGIAIRMCKGMGMNLNRIPAVFHKKVYEHIKIKRIFWCVYTWDRIFGFQSGKHFELSDEIINMAIPPLDDLSTTMDGWLTRPALAMIHLARICGDIQTLSHRGVLSDELVEKVHDELETWRKWTDENMEGEEELIVDQIYLTYHDMMLNLHNKVLFKLLDKDVQTQSTTKIQLLLLHSSKTLTIFQSISQRSLLLVPWWLNLVLLFNISLIDVMLINTGLHLTQAHSHFTQAMELLSMLKDKVGMAKECVWALKMLNHMIIMRFEKSMDVLKGVGVDHGSENVNKIKFLQFGKVDEEEKEGEELDMGIYGNDTDISDDLMNNLKWFDQWVSEFSN